tara:strand:+ start:113 stop:895 length:783 start_codon:yes stop_codon:yes gene_type:complete
MATDRELAAQSMMQAGIGSLSGRPDTTYRDKLQQITANAQAAQMGDWGRRPTPDDIRQTSINWGRKAGLGNRISFAGEGGRDILNPNEMRVNAPSVAHWKAMMMDRIKEQYQRLGKDNMIAPWASDLRSSGYGIPATNQGYKVMDAGGLDYTTWDWGKLNPFSWFNNEPTIENLDEDFLDQPLNSPERDEDGNIQPGWELQQQKNPETGEWEAWWEDTSIQANIPNWYKWYDKLINRFGEERGSQLWHQYAHRGGIIGLI